MKDKKIMDGFNEETLGKYLASGKVPPDAMIWLNQLLFKELQDYCSGCEEDRMICVLAPKCDARILLKVRIEANAKPEDLPRFCYGQYVNNIRRYLEKRTVLYTPIDNWLFNKDFLDIIMPNLYMKIIKNHLSNPENLHQILRKSKVPAVKFDFTEEDVDVFQKIIHKDKIIRERSFIYHLAGNYLLIWFDKDLFLVNFNSGITIVNAKNDIIIDLAVVDFVFCLYCAEANLSNFNTTINENEINFEIKIPMKEIDPEKLGDESTFLQEFIEYLQNHFFEIKIESKKKFEEYFVLSIKYNITRNFLERKGLNPLSFDALHKVLLTLTDLRTLNN